MTSSLHLGEALLWLQNQPTASADALITDPPYSSGGMMRSDRAHQTANQKYTHGGTMNLRPEFSGDNRDQRAWITWVGIWLQEAQRVVRPGGYACVFVDWRQLPAMTDALQVGGWVWRGLAVWDKGAGARAPHKGYFRHQAEFIVWGSNGSLPTASHDGPYPGVMHETVKQTDKFHVTGKPTELMRQLVRIVPPGGMVIDPFAGSGTTGVAAVLSGRRFAGAEINPEYYAVAQARIAEAQIAAEEARRAPSVIVDI